MREIPMTEERKYAVLFAATILAARQLADLGDLAADRKSRWLEDHSLLHRCEFGRQTRRLHHT
jgi:hypothetical protein